MNDGKSKSTKLARNSHTYEEKAFKIYNKLHVDNHILFLIFFDHVKWKYEQFLFFHEKIKADFKPQVVTFFVGKVTIFPETEIEQYFVILET